MAVQQLGAEPEGRVATLRRTRLAKPAALGLAYVGVAAGRIVGEEVRAYWRLHQLTRALAYPEGSDASEPSRAR